MIFRIQSYIKCGLCFVHCELLWSLTASVRVRGEILFLPMTLLMWIVCVNLKTRNLELELGLKLVGDSMQNDIEVSFSVYC